MSRLPRLYAPRIPQLVQARLAYPLATSDQPAPAQALDTVADWLGRDAAGAALALHAWALLPDGITLLATPDDARALPLLVQALGRRMGSGLVRKRVFTGRYHNALLEPGRWVLPAMLWLECLPVDGGWVAQATQWPWSSATAHAGLPQPAGAAALRDHPDYWQVGDTPFARQAAWRERLARGPDATTRAQLEGVLRGQWALGEKIFLAHLARLASRRIGPAARGRPRRLHVVS